MNGMKGMKSINGILTIAHLTLHEVRGRKVVLAAAILGLYVFRLSGAWRWIYIVCAVFALYLNCFVGVVQAFLKIPALKALAPTQAEPPFLVAQLLLLVVFIVLGFLAVRRFTPAAA